jgi:retron-type reverse transcriptase
VQHDVLLNILNTDIKCQETLELLRKLLKVGYVDVYNLTKREEYKKEGTPQGSIISPLMVNIYLHKLDVYIEKLSKVFNKGEIGKQSKQNSIIRYRLENVTKTEIDENPIISKYPSLKKIIPIVKKNYAIVNNQNFMTLEDGQFKRLYFVRYADDILLGMIGAKEECKSILRKINTFLQEELKLELNHDKCEINLAWEKQTKYLGFLLGRYHKSIQSKEKNISLENLVEYNIKKLSEQAMNNVALHVPTKDILDKLTKKGFLRKLSKSNRYKGRGVG